MQRGQAPSTATSRQESRSKNIAMETPQRCCPSAPRPPQCPELSWRPPTAPGLPALPTGLSALGAAGLGGLCAVTPAQTQRLSRATQNAFWGTRRVRACVHSGEGQRRQSSQCSQEGTMLLRDAGYIEGSPQGPAVSFLGTCCRVCRQHRGAEAPAGRRSMRARWGRQEGGHWRHGCMARAEAYSNRHRCFTGVRTRVSWGATRSRTGLQGAQKERGNGGRGSAMAWRCPGTGCLPPAGMEQGL